MTTDNTERGTIDTKRTDYPVCPHCGHEHEEEWEINFGGAEGSTEIHCESCEEEFYVSRHVTVHFNTAKIGESIW